MSRPFLSVVVPTFHRNQSLAQILEALRPGQPALAPELYEVIVSDAGTHTTAKALLEESYPWAILVSAKGCSPGANRNTGAKVATGEWLVFVDDDCRIEPGFLDGYYAMAKTGLFDVLEGKITCQEKANSPFRRQVQNLSGGILITGNLALRRELFLRLGPFDEDLKIAEDLELAHRLRTGGARIGFCAEATVDHPSQPTGWRHFWTNTFHRRWFVLYRYKLEGSGLLKNPLPLALARTTCEEFIFWLRVTWHLFSQHDPGTWRFHWFWTLWGWLSLPVTLPCIWFWECRYRNAIRNGEIQLRASSPRAS